MSKLRTDPGPLRVNPSVVALHPYVPGEQPQGTGYIKLNTNENAFGPPPAVLRAIEEEAHAGALQKYPDPHCTLLRSVIAPALGFEPENIFVGNGSDELLRLICHPYLSAGDSIAALFPTYVL